MFSGMFAFPNRWCLSVKFASWFTNKSHARVVTFSLPAPFMFRAPCRVLRGCSLGDGCSGSLVLAGALCPWASTCPMVSYPMCYHCGCETRIGSPCRKAAPWQGQLEVSQTGVGQKGVLTVTFWNEAAFWSSQLSLVTFCVHVYSFSTLLVSLHLQ